MIEEIDSIVWGGTMKTNRIEPLDNNITLHNCNLDINSIVSNINNILEESSPLFFHNKKLEFQNSNIRLNNTNLHNNCIHTNHLKKLIIDKDYLKSNSILGEHIVEKTINTKHLDNNIIISKNLTNKCILNKHLNNNIIKIHNLDPNIGYIFQKFQLDNGITTLDLDYLKCSNIGIKDDTGKIIWKIELDKETNNLLFLKLVDGKYIKHKITMENI